MTKENARARVEAAGYDTPAFAHLYDTARPPVPPLVLDLLQQMVGGYPLQLVVDLGCGTGLSTRPWAAYAAAVIGIEPNAAMRQQAASHPETPAHLYYRDGFSHQTGLAEASADVVTCSQALHWMEPEPTFAEVARLLRPGGIFAAYDYQLLPAISATVDEALTHFVDQTKGIRVGEQGSTCEAREQGSASVKQRWPREGHLARMQASGHFRFVKEMWFHSQERGNAGRLVNYLRSIDGVHRLLSAGSPEAQVALAQLQSKLHEFLGETAVTLYWSYQMWLGVR
jgi:SAM-dependent methyltransferase